MAQFLVAMDVLDQAGVSPAFNLKVVVDTEAELGMQPLSEDLVYEMGATRLPE